MQGIVLRGTASILTRQPAAPGRRPPVSSGLAGDDLRPYHDGRSGPGRGDECHLNLAFTRTGLAKLGFPEAVLATFPTAFFEGMASENRSRILGDDDVSALRNTGPGAARARKSTRSCMIFAKDLRTLDQAVKAEQAAMKGVPSSSTA